MHRPQDEAPVVPPATEFKWYALAARHTTRSRSMTGKRDPQFTCGPLRAPFLYCTALPSTSFGLSSLERHYGQLHLPNCKMPSTTLGKRTRSSRQEGKSATV
jgi:hypothetical protein